MKNKYLSILLLFLTLSSKAQFLTAGFQEMSLGASDYYNGSDLSGGFVSGPIFFSNEYNAAFSSWSGFGVSSRTDTSNGTFGNQYSCYAGVGGNGSSQFSIAYCYSEVRLKPANPQQTLKLQSFQYTNSTWAGRSMKFGDAFSKKFGGPSGNDPDFFKLRVFNYFGGQITDSADVYLADFRFANNQEDYIVKDWRTANFNFSNPSDSIGFRMESTDVGAFGINTPTYFCLDNVVFNNLTSVQPAFATQKLNAWPQPFSEAIQFSGLTPGAEIQVFDCKGKMIFQEIPTESNFRISSAAHWEPGLYIIRQGQHFVKVLKN